MVLDDRDLSFQQHIELVAPVSLADDDFAREVLGLLGRLMYGIELVETQLCEQADLLQGQ